MSVADDVIGLPGFLLDGSCGCERASWGRHLVSCEPARVFDAIPLQERDGYALGQRFQAVGWVFPLTIEVDVRVSVEVDPVAYITQHLAEYEAFEMENGFEEWEKPVQFIAHHIEEETGDWEALGWNPHITHDHVNITDIREHPQWRPEHATPIKHAQETAAARAAQQTAHAPIPGQTTLDIAGNTPQ